MFPLFVKEGSGEFVIVKTEFSFKHYIVKAGESDQIEFKKSTAELKNALEDLYAFANHQSGSLILGIDDIGNVIGSEQELRRS